MKIILPEGGPKQFGAIYVSCSDLKMAEMLSARHKFPEQHIEAFLQAFKSFRSGGTSFFEYCFRSGAKLKINSGKGPGFYIYCYHYSGNDGLMAAEELRIYENLRQITKNMNAYSKLEAPSSRNTISLERFLA